VKDLQSGMVLEGRVSNVTNFGAFVDIGVHRDGLVHVSELTHRWVADPREAAQVGQIVKVKVLEVDYQRERISLSIKALQQPPAVSAATARQSTGSPANTARAGVRPERPAVPQPPRQPAARPVAGGAKTPPPPPKPQGPASLEDLMKKFNRR
jgi:protein Tex